MLAALFLLAHPLLATAGASPPAAPSYIPYAAARPVLEAMPEALPDPLREKDAAAREAFWPTWVAERDREIRSRLARGTEDSVAHFMLFGTTFTSEPRATIEDVARLPTSVDRSDLAGRILGRIRDMARALASPGSNERLAFVRHLLVAKGLDPAAPEGRAQVERYLYDNLKRVLSENEGYAKALAEGRSLQDATAAFAQRSTLFSERGLSSDTSLLPNVAIEEALAALKQRGDLAAGSVRNVAVVGPGLDFTDKRDGYDFYPQQTIQPFAIMDSLLRLGLASRDGLRVATFDLNPQVNDHLGRAVAAARHGQGYVVQLPREASVAWTPSVLRYWEAFGDRIGDPAPPVPLPSGLTDVRTRAVRIRPDVVARVSTSDLDVVLQRPAAGESFDLVIATNILVYYGTFEQSLAVANIGAMLRPGGFLLSNNGLLELPSSPVRSVGYSTTEYSNRPSDGDHIVWYRRRVE
jgi:hypothetical protein